MDSIKSNKPSLFSFFASIGRSVIDFVSDVGEAGVILFRSIVRIPNVRKGFPLLLDQIYFQGTLSLLIIAVSGMFIGMVLALQGNHVLEQFNSQEALGQMVALSVVRELGPVVTALLFAGRAGSALTAEIGLMQATDQISMLEMMAVDPLQRIIAPRFWGGFISMPILTIIFSAVAIFGAYLLGVKWLGLDGGLFWSNMRDNVNFADDVWQGIVKSFVFGAVVLWISVYQGYRAKPTAAGVSQATTRTVVYSSLMILGLDFVLTAVMLGGWK
jgi:phospholipid/cholesterol/gamma-HCH transport system permease protein